MNCFQRIAGMVINPTYKYATPFYAVQPIPLPIFCFVRIMRSFFGVVLFGGGVED
jgi:hypothetical protein